MGGNGVGSQTANRLNKETFSGVIKNPGCEFTMVKLPFVVDVSVLNTGGVVVEHGAKQGGVDLVLIGFCHEWIVADDRGATQGIKDMMAEFVSGSTEKNVCFQTI